MSIIYFMGFMAIAAVAERVIEFIQIRRNAAKVRKMRMRMYQCFD